MSTGAIALVVAVAAAVVLGAWRAYADGRFRGTHRVRGAEAPAAQPVESVWDLVISTGSITDKGGSTTSLLGERATLLQFSTAFCAPCRATRRILSDVAAKVPGVAHVEIDAEHHLDLVRRVGITRTPTTLVLDRDGHERTRAAGAPTTSQVLQAIAGLS